MNAMKMAGINTTKNSDRTRSNGSLIAPLQPLTRAMKVVERTPVTAARRKWLLGTTQFLAVLTRTQ